MRKVSELTSEDEYVQMTLYPVAIGDIRDDTKRRKHGRDG